MLYQKETPFDLEELTEVVNKVITHLDISIAELERECSIPEKVLVMSLSGSRNLPFKHQLSLRSYIDKNKISSLFKEKYVLGKLTQKNLDIKKFWFNHVLVGVKRRIEREEEEK
jgi:hypothetical protein